MHRVCLGVVCALAFGMFLGPVGCSGGNEAPPQSVESDAEDLGLIGGKADGETTRQVELKLGRGEIKRYRVTAAEFRASLTQAGEVPVQLSAKHYEVDIYGEPATEPTVVAVADGTVRNWTLRVHNQGTDVLDGTLLVEEVVPRPGVEVGIVSDIDSTVMPPEEGDVMPPPYPGIAQLLTELETGERGTPGDMYYVTARVPERVVGVPAWMATWGVPQGPIETGVSGVPWIAQKEKVADISGILDVNYEQRFVFFGDSSHVDPEVLTEIKASYPERVAAAFIHDVDDPDPSRVEGLYVIDNYAQAAAILLSLELLDEAAARRVMVAAQQEGLEISDDQIDALIAGHTP